ncbi:DUF530 domain-containing protein [Methanobacterium paludis]|uniref:DUF530 domain-containing protein n=1 Tax=Methanobacterium paludis (strain DSM 25820 / JCM 18151 / SWAN1) TaxID=868131 RepID=F6D2K7_METPW|nr:DUF530 domain-containing protein [Methanobacterium paludis]AEG17941.1 protein of unknown function DUF530 [Methanobacterium paludis]
MNESGLIANAEKFLDGIKHERINADEIPDFKTFMEIYRYLKDNLDKLQDLRDTMEIKGYKAPYRSILRYGRQSSMEMKADDMYDISRHTHYFRMKAAAKKNILDRVKSAIASHKIALGHLEEFAIISCSSCGKKFRGHEISFIAFKACECGCNEFELSINKEGVYRLNIIKYLPLSGEYMVRMSELSPLGRDAFRKIVRIIKHEKRGIVKTLSLVVKVLEDGKWVRKRVNLDATDQLNYEKEIRRKYGSNARIEFMQVHRKKPAIINDKHVQTAVSIAYVKLAEHNAREIFDTVLNNFISNKEKLSFYDNALKTAKKRANRIAEDIDDKEDLTNELLYKMLKDEKLINDKGNRDKELEKDIKIRSKLEISLFVDMPQILILWDIIKYYLLTSYDRRSRYSGPFPNLRPSLDTNQMKAFEDFDEFVVGILRDYLAENIKYIPNIKSVVSKKFEIENKVKGLHVAINTPAAGAAILNTTGKLSIEDSAHIFSVNPAEVSKEVEKFKTFGKPQTKKAKKFLEMVKR